MAKNYWLEDARTNYVDSIFFKGTDEILFRMVFGEMTSKGPEIVVYEYRRGAYGKKQVVADYIARWAELKAMGYKEV